MRVREALNSHPPPPNHFNGAMVRIQHHPSSSNSYPPTSMAEEWRLPGNEDVPSPPEGYVMSFAHFHERGFAIPAHKFLRGLLDYYQVEL